MKRFLSELLFSCILCTLTYHVSAADYAKGADVGWLSEMESQGRTFYNNNGTQQDLLQILKDKGINSIRLRVWVNPANGWCGKTDVVNQAKRARDMGFRIMIDFHYSDSWADPGQQTKPAAWATHNISQLISDVNTHTLDVLNALKTAGVTPEWVQVGNETNNGMLWEEGKASVNMKNFADLVTSGHNAVKTVFPDAKVVVHISNGYDNALFRWMFDGLKNNGAKWDVIGMSLYPTAANWQTLTAQCLTNMQDMVSRYGKEVVISEIGMAASEAQAAKEFITDILAKNKSLPNNKGIGVFYWEPQAYNSWKGYGLGAFDTSGKPTIAMDAFLDPCKATITAGGATAFCQGAGVTLTASTGVSYKWFNGTTQLATTTQSLSATSSGSYTVEVTDANACKAISSATVVTVNALPTAAITAGGATTFCQGGSVTLTASAGSSYKWFNGTTQLATTTQALSANVSGSYTVEVKNANNCKATSAPATVTVTSATTWYADTDGDGKGDPAVTQSACSKPSGYVSTAGDACPADANKTAPGNCGCGKTENSCLDCAGVSNGSAAIDVCGICSGGTTGKVPVTDPVNCTTTGVVDPGATDVVKISPNPSSDRFYLSLAQTSSIQIMTAEGKRVEAFSGVNNIHFGEGYAKGVYVVQICNGNSIQVLRVVKQ